MEIGTRVYHQRLKDGSVVKDERAEEDMITVKWDQRPDVLYNAGVNPCKVHKDSVEEIKFSPIEIDEDELDDAWFDMLKNIGTPY